MTSAQKQWNSAFVASSVSTTRGTITELATGAMKFFTRSQFCNSPRVVLVQEDHIGTKAMNFLPVASSVIARE